METEQVGWYGDDTATTGDGILTAIMLMEQVVSRKLPLSKLCEAMVMYPQICASIRVPNKDAVMGNPTVIARLEELNDRLGSCGRLLLRKSGTEPVIRVMAEAETEDICQSLVNEMLSVIRTEGLT